MRRMLLGLGGLALFVLSGCVGPGVVEEHERRVVLGDNFFDPATIEAGSGQTLLFVNEGQRTHTVTIRMANTDENRFDEEIRPGSEIATVLSTPGDYEMRCRFHSSGFDSGMVGTIFVSPSGEA